MRFLYNTPNHWKQKNFLSFLFFPISLFYLLGLNIYRKIKDEKKINIPVVCVGNLNVGGSGKTPVSIKLRKLLSKKYSKIFILTRGYRGKIKGPIVVKQNMNYLNVGDEALLHSKFGKTCVSKNKIAGGKFCEKKGANLIILDDGFQSKNLRKDFFLLVLDKELGIKNKFMLPAGPLREPFNTAIERSDAIIFFGKKNELNLKQKNKKVFLAKKILKPMKIKNNNVFAFSGIGNNENFYNCLKKLKLNIVHFEKFPDHYHYSEHEISEIIFKANKENLSVVCTLKDYVKIPKKFKNKIFYFDLEIQIQKSKDLINLIYERLNIKKIQS